jgi:cytochrome b involved in lipid metabolism
MSRKNLALLLGAIVIIIVVIIVMVQNHKSPSAAPATGEATQATTATPATQTATATYTLAQVAMHNKASSCWTAINGSVYDVTTWINQHPGGPGPILSLCGTDGSAAFNGQHGGQARPAAELATFKIGTLVQ